MSAFQVLIKGSFPPRCNSRFSYEILQSIAIIAGASERNQLKYKVEIMDKTEKT